MTFVASAGGRKRTSATLTRLSVGVAFVEIGDPVSSRIVFSFSRMPQAMRPADSYFTYFTLAWAERPLLLPSAIDNAAATIMARVFITPSRRVSDPASEDYTRLRSFGATAGKPAT